MSDPVYDLPFHELSNEKIAILLDLIETELIRRNQGLEAQDVKRAAANLRRPTDQREAE